MAPAAMDAAPAAMDAAEGEGKLDDNLLDVALPLLKGPARNPVYAEAEAEQARAEQEKSKPDKQKEMPRSYSTKSGACPSTGILQNRLLAVSEIIIRITHGAPARPRGARKSAHGAPANPGPGQL